jgi:hypothetical protein
VVGIRARTSHRTFGNASNSLGGGAVNVVESTGIESVVLVALTPPLGVAGGVTAGESNEAGGSVDPSPHSDSECVD